MTNNVDVNQILTQLKSLSQAAAGNTPTQETANPSTSFADVMEKTLDTVHNSQQNAANIAAKAEDPAANVEISEVMVSMQKANVSFQAMTQVRNKLVTAYKDVMNMQV